MDIEEMIARDKAEWAKQDRKLKLAGFSVVAFMVSFLAGLTWHENHNKTTCQA